jgi:hypothetical protein
VLSKGREGMQNVIILWWYFTSLSRASSTVRCGGLAKSFPYVSVLCPWSGLSPVHSLLEQCILDVVLPFGPRLPLVLLPSYRASHAMPGYLDSGILTTWPNQRSWICDCRGLTFSAIRIDWLRTSSLLVFCSTLRRYLISAAWSLVCYFVLSVHDSAL